MTPPIKYSFVNQFIGRRLVIRSAANLDCYTGRLYQTNEGWIGISDNGPNDLTWISIDQLVSFRVAG